MGDSTEVICERYLDGDHSEVYVVNPSSPLLNSLFEAIQDTDGDIPELRILGSVEQIKRATAVFKTASRVADLIDDGFCSLRSIEGYGRNSMLIADSTISFYSSVGGDTLSFSCGQDGNVEKLSEQIAREWETGGLHKLRTPPISRVLDTLEEELGEECRQSLDAALVEWPAIKNSDANFDIVSLVILIAARHEVLLYDLSRWSEDIGLASKATISREKGFLEDRGLIETSTVQQDIGRPRLRLHLPDSLSTTWSQDGIESAMQILRGE